MHFCGFCTSTEMNWNTYIIDCTPSGQTLSMQLSAGVVWFNAIVLCIHVPSYPVHCSFLWRVLSLAVFERRAWCLCFEAAGFSQMGDVLWVWRLERRGIFRMRHYQPWTDRPVVICWVRQWRHFKQNSRACSLLSYTETSNCAQEGGRDNRHCFQWWHSRKRGRGREREFVYMCVILFLL